jgi:hypothetical protein
MSDDGAWRLNYFNYFTEIEEHFQIARGTGLFLLSPLDWALIESWKNAGIPLEAVLRGIDAAFEKWRARKKKTQAVNSLAYCAQAVLTEAKSMADNLTGVAPPGEAEAEAESKFSFEQVKTHLERGIAKIQVLPGYSDIVRSLESILAALPEHFKHLEELDQRLTAVEEKMAAIARTLLPDEVLFEARRELDMQLRPYRSKLTAEHLKMLEQKFLDRAVFERAGLPRLSLFYLE